jgi:hypothetical protein
MKSYANGNAPNVSGNGGGNSGIGVKPAAVMAAETSSWTLTLGVSPGLFAS